MNDSRICTIDGPAGAGKSTVAKAVARSLGWQLLDTGAIYRALAVVAEARAVAWDAEPALAALATEMNVRFQLEGDRNRMFVTVGQQPEEEVTGKLRTPEISNGASAVSKLPTVRAALLGLQRRLGERGEVVVEGRDTGTVVFPTAGAKFFLTASAEERARRRWDELRAAGQDIDFARVLGEQVARDEQDTQRAAAPLRQADDAALVDSSGVPLEAVIARIADAVRARFRLT
ncbi:MAG: (d)CMP kinase [Deltaproteobacteria bacterium]|nr:(d)CMP kinase [Deltaproteobacteria bacterium]